MLPQDPLCNDRPCRHAAPREITIFLLTGAKNFVNINRSADIRPASKAYSWFVFIEVFTIQLYLLWSGDGYDLNLISNYCLILLFTNKSALGGEFIATVITETMRSSHFYEGMLVVPRSMFYLRTVNFFVELIVVPQQCFFDNFFPLCNTQSDGWTILLSV